MNQPTTLTAALTLLAQHNEWRRGVSDDLRPTDPRELGAAIDLVCEVVPELLAALTAAEDLIGLLAFVGASTPRDGSVGAQIRAAIKKAGGAA